MPSPHIKGLKNVPGSTSISHHQRKLPTPEIFGGLTADLEDTMTEAPGNDVADVANFKTFTRFGELPTELRDMIRIFAIPKQIVVVDHSYEEHRALTRRNLPTPIPPMLVLCHDSRKISLPLYYTTFGKPVVGPLKWHYTGSTEYSAIKKIARGLIRKRYGYKTLTSEPVAQVIEYLESTRPDATETEYARKFAKTERTILPTWFHANEDILYMKFTPKETVRWTRTGLWNLRTPSKVGNIKHLALELGTLHPTNNAHHPLRNGRVWTKLADWYGMRNYDLKSLSLVLLEEYENIVITVDDEGVLEAGQWSYALDSGGDLFKEQVVENKYVYSGVTWRVTLAKVNGQSLWQQAKAWKPLQMAWESHKQVLLEGKLAKTHEWYGASLRSRRAVKQWAKIPLRALVVNGIATESYLG